MASQKPSVPKGTRDFSPEEMVRRNYIFDTIRSVFKKYGYQPIETPAMENTETLMGKYGEEGDRLIFKILDSGDYISKVPFTKELNQTREKMTALSTASMNTKEEVLNEFESLTGLLLRWVDIGLSSHKLTGYISEKALRYDLTVPFARYVVQHQNEITFPFKRYQIQPVWRADRPQKGRYREFYQCDADVIGSDSLINEVELVQMMDEVFKALKVPVTIKINNRKILSGIAEFVGEKERLVDIVVAIDKYEKIGEKIYDELREKNFSAEVIEKVKEFMLCAIEAQKLAEQDRGKSALNYLRKVFNGIEIGQKGVDEIETIFAYFDQVNSGKEKLPNLVLDIALARGLNYYTGAIFEVKANAGTLTSSITGGGRYDDLTGIFGLPGLSGVGISFGADRIYDVLNELNLYPESVTAGTRLLFANFGGGDEMHCLKLLRQVRAAGISAEIYPDAVKMGKQFKYADAKKIPFVAIIGENERKGGFVTLKNMTTGEQLPVNENELIHKVE